MKRGLHHACHQSLVTLGGARLPAKIVRPLRPEVTKRSVPLVRGPTMLRFTYALLSASLLIILATVAPGATAEVGCTVKGVKSDWRAVALDRPPPDGITVEWRSNYGKAFSECLNELTIRIRNSGERRQTIDLGSCRFDGKHKSGPRLTVAPGKSASALLDMVQTPSIGEIRCDGMNSLARGKGASSRLAAKKTPNERRVASIKHINSLLPTHNSASSGASRKMILTALDFSTLSDTGDRADLALHVQRAWNEIRVLREEGEPGIPLRDAEYYLMGLYAGLSGDTYLNIASDFAEAYLAYKWVMTHLGMESAVRVDPNVPTTPPGGADWVHAGVLEGRLLRDGWRGIPHAKQAIERNIPSEKK